MPPPILSVRKKYPMLERVKYIFKTVKFHFSIIYKGRFCYVCQKVHFLHIFNNSGAWSENIVKK